MCYCRNMLAYLKNSHHSFTALVCHHFRRISFWFFCKITGDFLKLKNSVYMHLYVQCNLPFFQLKFVSSQLAISLLFHLMVDYSVAMLMCISAPAL